MAAVEGPAVWTESFAAFKSHVASLTAWQIVIAKNMRTQDLMSAPEIFDAKTDVRCNYSEVPPLEVVAVKGGIADPATLSVTELVDAFDVVTAFESMWLDGGNIIATVMQCVYFHRAGELPEGHPLRAYVIAVLKGVDLVRTASMAGGVSDEEEFSVVSTEPEFFTGGLDDQTVLTALLTAIDQIDNGTFAPAGAEDAVAKAALRARFAYRHQYLEMLLQFNAATRDSTVRARASALRCRELLALPAMARTAEPAVNPLIFSPTAGRWFGVVASALRPVSAWKVAATVLRDMFTHYVRAVDLVDLTNDANVWTIVAAVEDFAIGLRPGVPVRSRAVQMVLGPQASGGSVLFGEGLPRRILRALSACHGAPLYEQIADKNKEAMEETAQFAVAKFPNAATVLAQAQDGRMPTSAEVLLFHKTHAYNSVARWATSIAGKAMALIISALLCNRGRCHRRLANLVSNLPDFHEASTQIDLQSFIPYIPATPEAGAAKGPARMEPDRANCVLTAFVADIAFFAAEAFLEATNELGLATTAEVVPMISYFSYGARLRSDLFVTALCVTEGHQIPKRSAKDQNGRPRFSLAASTRVLCPPQALPVMARCDALRHCASLTLTLLGASTAAGLLNLSLPASSLVDASTMFNNRVACFHKASCPPFVPYSVCTREFDEVVQMHKANPAAFLDVLTRLSSQFKQVAAMVHGHVAEAEPMLSSGFFTAAEKSCRANIVAIGLLTTAWKKAAGTDSSAPAAIAEAVLAQYAFTVGFPHHGGLAVLMIKLK